MSFFSFGEDISGYEYKVLNEREVRGVSGLILALGVYAFIRVFIQHHFGVLPIVSGILVIHFLISVLVNPKFSPFSMLSRLFIRKQTPLYIGAVQKRFAWSLGSALSLTIFVLSTTFYVTNDFAYLKPACILCIVCMLLMFLESVFAICVGCKLYFFFIRIKLIKKPEVSPKCMGDVCEI